ncbi:MAG TPA: 2-hydroxycarboxylate transporter family protein [Stellaceae bacterium]|nr:2-hydroxycarboxylate transporter family protein [Stellaceae bacterium]
MTDSVALGPASARFWPQGWWKLVEFRIGIVPLPVYVVLAGLVAFFILRDGKVASDLPTMIAVLALGGFGCAEIGRRLPVIRNLGAAAIFATFVPSYLVYAHLLPEGMLKPIAEFTKASNFLYLFIAAIIVGSIFGMDRQVLIKGFLKIFVPLAAGSVVAGTVGTLIGVALGLGAYHTFFFIVIPIMAGGVGEGAIPLSIGYAEILRQEQGTLFAQVLPPIMLGSLTAILLAGFLNWVGKRLPRLTGEGRLQPGVGEELIPGEEKAAASAVDPGAIAAAGVTAIALYLLGTACFKLFGLPGPVAMLFLAVVVKLTRAVPPSLQLAGQTVYKFFSTAVTYPLLFAIGVSLTPWETLVAALTPANIAVIVLTVASLMATGFFVGRLLGMYPIETAIINACHSGQGGTGDIAILTAANRLELMPFAQIATRIGGAITVTLTLIFLAQLA